MTFTSSETIAVPVPHVPGLSSYYTSKLALTKLVEYIAAETPEIQILAFNPGVVATDTNRKSGFTMIPYDEGESTLLLPCSFLLGLWLRGVVELPAHFAVWAASKEAEPFNGRYINCNWDVEELLAIKDKFAPGTLFQTCAVSGWPYEDMH
jgi:NAD(P)-dependent dehydrogenase (short-subunit alcohol dehydrogenase family)